MAMEKVVLVALTEKEAKFIKSQTRSIHNWLLKQDKEKGYISKQSDETRTLTGAIGGKLSFAGLYSTNQKTLERDLANRLKAYKEVSNGNSK